LIKKWSYRVHSQGLDITTLVRFKKGKFITAAFVKKLAQKTPLDVFKITNHHHYAKTAHHI
jgi:hypothetical protein